MEKNDLGYVFKGNQEELNKYILQSKYYEVPIAKWGDFYVIYNKLDGIFQDNNGDITPYFERCISLEETLEDITEYLCNEDVRTEFIDHLVELLYDNQLDTYDYDISEEEIDRINKEMETTVPEIDPKDFDFYDRDEWKKEVKEIDALLGFDPQKLTKYFNKYMNE